MRTLGAARFVTCPGCGVGEATALCTLTRGEVETLACDACRLLLRDGVIIERGVDLGPDDVRHIGGLALERGADSELYVPPEARSLRLHAVSSAEPTGESLPAISSITIRFTRSARGTEASLR